MKFNLKETTKVVVGLSTLDQYTYVSEDEHAIVQFHAGKLAWTYELGLATNEAGQAVAKEVVRAFTHVCHSELAKHPTDASALVASFNESIKTLEVS